MALTKADIVESIIDQIGFTKNKSTDITGTDARLSIVKA
jgi:hypothetical protein